jgi:pterin-4a-carbinolamine dehydratase
MDTSPAGNAGTGAVFEPLPIREELKAERIQAALQELPGWELSAEGKAITRTFPVTASASRALIAFAGYVTELAQYHGVEASLEVRLGGVTVTLSNRAGGPVTEGELAMAQALEG